MYVNRHVPIREKYCIKKINLVGPTKWQVSDFMRALCIVATAHFTRKQGRIIHTIGSCGTPFLPHTLSVMCS